MKEIEDFINLIKGKITETFPQDSGHYFTWNEYEFLVVSIEGLFSFYLRGSRLLGCNEKIEYAWDNDAILKIMDDLDHAQTELEEFLREKKIKASIFVQGKPKPELSKIVQAHVMLNETNEPFFCIRAQIKVGGKEKQLGLGRGFQSPKKAWDFIKQELEDILIGY